MLIAEASVKMPVLRKKPNLSLGAKDAQQLALCERNALALLEKCETCGIQGNPDEGFNWACVVLLNDDKSVSKDELYIVKYDVLSCHREGLYTDIGNNGKKVCLFCLNLFHR